MGVLSMFSFFKKITGPSEVVRMLQKNYSYDASIESVTRYMSWAIVGNNHNTCIEYISANIQFMDKNNPADILRAKKFIRVAKQGLMNGYITNLIAYEGLLENIRTRLDIDVDTIEPSSL